MAKEFTIGIEEEYQIINPGSRELTSYIQEFLDQGRLILQDQIKPEFLQSQVEVGTNICRSMKEARQEMIRLRKSVAEILDQHGKAIVAASTHPFSKWDTQQVTVGERYTQLRTDMAELARRMLIFGMHVHVGMDDRDLMIDVMNQVRYFLPHILALSTSSPFWDGRDTGLKSYRSVVFESLPRTGIPPAFDSWNDYQNFVTTLRETGCIEEPSKIWWDVRPHSKFDTIEFRICDICTSVDDALCIGAVVVALVAKLCDLRRSNRTWRPYRHHLIVENKWRAVRFGLDGKLIDFGRGMEVPIRDLMGELLDFVDDVLDEYGLREDVEHIHTILARGTSADRQLEVFQATGRMQDVVDYLAEETLNFG